MVYNLNDVGRSESPIFVFAAVARSGSTLVQRLIGASGEVLMWGETGGALDLLEDAIERYAQKLGELHVRFRHSFGGGGRKQYETFVATCEGNSQVWIANMNPPQEVIRTAFLALFDALYGAPAATLGYQR